MSLFEELYAKYKKEQDEEKNVPFVTCIREVKNTNALDLSSSNISAISTMRAQETDGTLLLDPQPGECDLCPACGYWDKPMSGPGKYCFYEAYFLAKPAKAQLAKTRQEDCPLNEGR